MATKRQGKKLENIRSKFVRFINNPNLLNKELILNLVTSNDLNEENYFGLCRFTDYEVAMINEIYKYATIVLCTQAKLWIYEFLIDAVILKKTMKMMMSNKSFNEVFVGGSYSCLHHALRVFYNAYAYFRTEKDKTFFQHLIITIKMFYDIARFQDQLLEYVGGIITLIYDLSFNINSKKLAICKFDRNEIKILFEIIINIMNDNHIDPTERPYRGMINILIANYVLKSRNSNKNGFIYKCLTPMKLRRKRLKIKKFG